MALEPNSFELAGEGLKISYTTTSFAGVPQLTVQMNGNEIVASGGDFRIEQSVLGSVVTLDVETVPDDRTQSLSVLVPKVHLDDDSQTVEIESLAIESTHPTSIAGTDAVRGQVITYDKVISLCGTANHFQF